MLNTEQLERIKQECGGDPELLEEVLKEIEEMLARGLDFDAAFNCLVDVDPPWPENVESFDSFMGRGMYDRDS